MFDIFECYCGFEPGFFGLWLYVGIIATCRICADMSCSEGIVDTSDLTQIRGLRMAAKKKLTLYFPEEILTETKEEAVRQERSISWILQTAWRIARDEIGQYPSVDELWDRDRTRAAS